MNEEDVLIQRVGARLKRLRYAAGLTQETMAARIECGLRNYQRLETGQVNMSLRTVARLAAALSLSPAELFADGAPASEVERPRTISAPQDEAQTIAHLQRGRA